MVCVHAFGSTSAVIMMITGIEGEVVSLRSTVCVTHQ